MPVERRKPKGVFRRMERWFVGVIMAVIAFVLEKAVMRSVKKGGKTTTPEATTITSKGGKAEI
jgi:hypothetical protein